MEREEYQLTFDDPILKEAAEIHSKGVWLDNLFFNVEEDAWNAQQNPFLGTYHLSYPDKSPAVFLIAFGSYDTEQNSKVIDTHQVLTAVQVFEGKTRDKALLITRNHYVERRWDQIEFYGAPFPTIHLDFNMSLDEAKITDIGQIIDNVYQAVELSDGWPKLRVNTLVAYDFFNNPEKFYSTETEAKAEPMPIDEPVQSVFI